MTRMRVTNRPSVGDLVGSGSFFPVVRAAHQRMDTIAVSRRAEEFCRAHGIIFASDDGFITVGQSGFDVDDVRDEKELQSTLDQCLREHNEIEAISWKSGLLYDALHRVGDDPTKAGIEEELARILDKTALDKIARVFYKYTRG